MGNILPFRSYVRSQQTPPICGGRGAAHWHVDSVGGQANGGRCRRHRGGAGGVGLSGVGHATGPEFTIASDVEKCVNRMACFAFR